jgi:hypothetical protein
VPFWLISRDNARRRQFSIYKTELAEIIVQSDDGLLLIGNRMPITRLFFEPIFVHTFK